MIACMDIGCGVVQILKCWSFTSQGDRYTTDAFSEYRRNHCAIRWPGTSNLHTEEQDIPGILAMGFQCGSVSIGPIL